MGNFFRSAGKSREAQGKSVANQMPTLRFKQIGFRPEPSWMKATLAARRQFLRAIFMAHILGAANGRACHKLAK